MGLSWSMANSMGRDSELKLELELDESRRQRELARRACAHSCSQRELKGAATRAKQRQLGGGSRTSVRHEPLPHQLQVATVASVKSESAVGDSQVQRRQRHSKQPKSKVHSANTTATQTTTSTTATTSTSTSATQTPKPASKLQKIKINKANKISPSTQTEDTSDSQTIGGGTANSLLQKSDQRSSPIDRQQTIGPRATKNATLLLQNLSSPIWWPAEQKHFNFHSIARAEGVKMSSIQYPQPPARTVLVNQQLRRPHHNAYQQQYLHQYPSQLNHKLQQLHYQNQHRNNNNSPAKGHNVEFTVMSYNVLSDRMVTADRYPKSPEISLNWNYRRQLILSQILDSGSDIIALQELEMEQYETYFKPQLSGIYESLFEPKSRAKTMDIEMRKRVDGCAIFYKTQRFKLIQSHLLEFNQIAMANAQGSEAMLNRVMTKDNIALAAILEFKQHETNTGSNKWSSGERKGNQQILVCNTHIHWNPEHCDVKLIQTIMLMTELKSIARQHLREQMISEQMEASTGVAASGPYNPKILAKFPVSATDDDSLLPLVLLGDFNSTPKSGVTSYLSTGHINSLHKDFKKFEYTSCSNALAMIPDIFLGSPFANSLNVATNPTLRRQSSPAWCYYHSNSASSSPSPSSSSSSSSSSTSSAYSSAGSSDSPKTTPVFTYEHPFKLASAYDRKTMPFTSYTTKFKAMIDYIYYTCDSLQVVASLGPLDKSWLKDHKIEGLPQPHLPSDHLPLVVLLRLQDSRIKSSK